jgi:hypothetical protein
VRPFRQLLVCDNSSAWHYFSPKEVPVGEDAEMPSRPVRRLGMTIPVSCPPVDIQSQNRRLLRRREIHMRTACPAVNTMLRASRPSHG